MTALASLRSRLPLAQPVSSVVVAVGASASLFVLVAMFHQILYRVFEAPTYLSLHTLAEMACFDLAGAGAGLWRTSRERCQSYGHALRGLFRSVLSVPLEIEGRTVGVLEAYSTQPAAFSADGATVLAAFADAAGTALRDARAHEEIQRLLKDVQAREEKLSAQNEELRASSAALSEAHADLAATNKELEAFSYSVSHDLRAPVRSISGFSRIVLEEHGDKLEPHAADYLRHIVESAQQMAQLIDGLLSLSRVARGELRHETVDLSALAQAVALELRDAEPGREAEFVIAPGLTAQGDPQLLRIVLVNLIGNAWKFSARVPCGRIEVGATEHEGKPAYFVRDNGAGFDMALADKLFGAFQRLHSETEFPGSGIGLATVQRIIHRHGGRIWATAAVGRGATFFFTLPLASSNSH